MTRIAAASNDWLTDPAVREPPAGVAETNGINLGM